MNWRTRLEQLMLEREWNQYDLADHTGYAQSNINRILKLDKPPSMRVQLKLANAFGVPVQSLLPGTVPEFIAVPVLQKDQLEDWLQQRLSDTQISEWVPSPVNRSGLYAYRLNAHDSQPGCEQGSTVIIDSAMDLTTNHKILCRVNQRTMVRQLTEASDARYLTALQPNLPAIELDESSTNFQYMGTVIFTLINENPA